ncbi:MAG: hypothetical protein PHQ12_07945, partial [Chthoniobacteraceae bacterium]|nr:hypothetical protein [Chthoniobacteraceae bacterium]
LCQLALLNADVRAWLSEHPWEPLFGALPGGELLVTIMRGQFDPANPSSVSAFLASLGSGEQAALAELLEKQSDRDRREHTVDPLKMAADCWRDLQRRDLERQRDAVAARARQPGLDFDEMMRLQLQARELQQQINALRA